MFCLFIYPHTKSSRGDNYFLFMYVAEMFVGLYRISIHILYLSFLCIHCNTILFIFIIYQLNNDITSPNHVIRGNFGFLYSPLPLPLLVQSTMPTRFVYRKLISLHSIISQLRQRRYIYVSCSIHTFEWHSMCLTESTKQE